MQQGSFDRDFHPISRESRTQVARRHAGNSGTAVPSLSASGGGNMPRAGGAESCVQALIAVIGIGPAPRCKRALPNTVFGPMLTKKHMAEAVKNQRCPVRTAPRTPLPTWSQEPRPSAMRQVPEPTLRSGRICPHRARRARRASPGRPGSWISYPGCLQPALAAASSNRSAAGAPACAERPGRRDSGQRR